ncbi:hypothetical protein LUCX_46 [Xanthomonas phage vB_XciM_LucasX]|nr:hypothetical protein LUCX_46 [Xanthomonas phage vB_XciM_LucasX]
MTREELVVMEDLGLDGHWLMATIAAQLYKEEFDPDHSEGGYLRGRNAQLVMLEESLYGDITAGFEAEGFDDQQLHRMDGYLEENMHVIMGAVEKILDALQEVLWHYLPPEHCLYRSVNRYLNGYSHEVGAGHLHFDFCDPP